MKKIFKILGIVVALILALMVIVPYVYKDKIVAIIKEEINRNINAKVDFTGFSLSLFRSFPDFNFRLNELSVINNQPFEGDTLAFIPKLDFTIDLMSVIKGEAYEVKKVGLSAPVFNLLVTSEGMANWDIALESAEPETETDQSGDSSPLLIKLRKVTISDSRLVYDDKSLVTYVVLEGLNHELSGDFTLDFTTLQTHTTINSLTVAYEGIKYLQKVNAELDAPVEADLNKFVFTIKNSELRLNQFYLLFEGVFEMPDNGDYVMDFSYSSKRTDFKDFMSLVPAMYATDLKNVKTAGNAIINGTVKGIYNDVTYPGFELNILINNARFHYPDLPKSVDEINAEMRINYPGGLDFDNLVVDVPNFSLFMGGNKLAIAFHLSNPISDMYLKGKVDGVVNLGEVKDFYPLPEGEDLKGKISLGVAFDGRMSTIEKEQYEDFDLSGTLQMESFEYVSTTLNKPVEISLAQLSFSPRFVDLNRFDLKIGNNDLAATGKLENFVPYALADGTLKGTLQLNSNYLNVSELLPESEETASTTDTTAMTVVEIPGNIDFTMQSFFKELIFNDIEMKNVDGKLIVADQTLTLDQLAMELLDGKMGVSGKYETKDPAQPKAEFNLNLTGLDIQKSYATFGTIEKFAPIAQKTSGKFSTSFNVKTLLNNQMMPVYNSMNGGGNLSTTDIVIQNFNTADKIADLLKMPDLKRLMLSPVNLSFEFIDGKLYVKPFDTKFQDINANTLGWVSFDQTIDFDMIISIPRAKFGSAANSVLDNLVSEANKLGTNFSISDIVNVKAKITGTATDPVVKIQPVAGSGQSLIDDLKKQAKEELDRQKEKLEEQARQELEKQKADLKQKADKIIADADLQATKIMEEAQKQADAINKTARESADKLKSEAYKQADNMVAEAKKKGPIAEIAAKKAAEQARKEADKKVEQMVAEAKNQSDKIIGEAQHQSDKLKTDARNEASKLLDSK